MTGLHWEDNVCACEGFPSNIMKFLEQILTWMPSLLVYLQCLSCEPRPHLELGDHPQPRQAYQYW